MPDTPWERMWSLFHAAFDVDAGRPRRVPRRRVRRRRGVAARAGGALLASHGRREGLLDRSPVEEAADVDVASDPLPGSRLGAYQVHGRIGEGGMGVVYDAEQQSPFAGGSRSRSSGRGCTPTSWRASRSSGRRWRSWTTQHRPRARRRGDRPTAGPFFVMEHVAGAPLSEYCDRNALDLRRRLDLFLPSARPSSTHIRRGSSTATSSPPTSW